MRLIELHIHSFGGVQDKKLLFGGGFQILYGPNEQGKSTVMACLHAMLYGMTGRARNIRDNARRRYLPWEKNRARATLLVERERRVFRLERTFGIRHAEDTISLTDDRSGQEIRLPNGMEPGGYWTGLSASEFEQSFFTGQMATQTHDPDGEMLSRLANLASTGQEEVSYPDIEDRLRRAQVKLRAERGPGGRINEAHAALDTLRENRETVLADEARKAVDIRRLGSLKAQEESTTRMREDVRARMEARERLENQMRHAESEQAALDRQVDTLRDEVKRLRSERAQQIRFAEESVRASSAQCEWLEKERDDLVREETEAQAPAVPDMPVPRFSHAGLLLTLSVCLLLAGIAAGIWAHPVLAACALTSLVPLAILLRSKRIGRQGVITRAEEQQRKNIRLVNVRGKIHELDARLAASREAARSDSETRRQTDERLLREQSETEQRIEALLPAAHEAKEKVEHMRETGGPDPGEGRLADLRDKEKRLERQTETLRSEIVHLEAGLRYDSTGLPGLVELDGRIAALSRQIRQDEFRCEGLELTRKVFRETMDAMQEDLGPWLNARAAEWLAQLTDGTYTGFRADRRFDIRIADRNETAYRSWAYMSGATVDQAYLALRLAMAERIAPDNDLPLLLDDALVQYDDRRARSAVHALMNRPGQTLLFTCQGRMLAYAKGVRADSEWTRIDL